MAPDQATEHIKKYSQLYPDLQPEVLARVREEFEGHEVGVVEKIVRQLWRETEIFSFRKLCDALRWESGRKDGEVKVFEARKKRRDQRLAADHSFEAAEKAVAKLSEKQFGELIAQAVAKRPGLERMLPKLNSRDSRLGQALVEQELRSATK